MGDVKLEAGGGVLYVGTRLDYDGANMRVTNHASANALLTCEYRKGFELA